MATSTIQHFNMDGDSIFQKLNMMEKQKLNLSPMDYYKEINNLHLDSLGKMERYYLQDFGIYNNELNDDEFMLRLRFPAGRISNENLLNIAQITKQYNLEIILTARAGMQLHGFDSENIIQVFHKLNDLGICSWQTFGDNIRNITTDIFDGYGQNNMIETYSYIKEMEDFILKVPQYVGLLPRRISIGISGSFVNNVSFFSSDLYFALAIKDGVYGFNVYMGGKNTEIAQDANIFLQKEQVVEFFKAFVVSFNKYGLRQYKNRTRLFHLLEAIGLETFKSHIETEYKNKFVSKGDILLKKTHFETFEILKDGSFGYAYLSNFAKITSSELLDIATLAIENNYKIRIGTDQQIYILGLKEKKIPLSNKNTNSTILACAGNQFCPFSYWNIKDETRFLPLERIEKHKLLIGFSGCMKGCAKHQHSDIGLLGLRSSSYDYTQKIARVYLGGEYTFGQKLAKQVFKGVPLPHLSDILNAIIDEFENSGYTDFEDFSKNILNHFSENFLALWFLAKVELPNDTQLIVNDEMEIFTNYFSEREFYRLLEGDFTEALKFQSQKIWSQSSL
jgi:ferredoxin-nitrite reductase